MESKFYNLRENDFVKNVVYKMYYPKKIYVWEIIKKIL